MIFSSDAERFVTGIIFTSLAGRRKMRACFLGQNICTLGFGVATLQAPPLVMDQPVRMLSEAEKTVSLEPGTGIPEAPIEPRPVANSPRMDA
jgi:hypothetical protein